MLYIHAQRLDVVLPVLELSSCYYVKAIDPDLQSARRCKELGIRLIVRNSNANSYIGYALADPMAAAVAFVDECREKPWWEYAWGIETANEPFSGQESVPQAWVDFETEVVGMMRAYGKECIVGNRANGHDGYYVPGAIYYGIHEYGWPTVMSDAPWMALRYQSWFPDILARDSQARLLITEFGSTEAVIPGHNDISWNRPDSGISPDEYWTGITQYIDQVRQDSYVLGAFLFNWGIYPPWESFEHLNTIIESNFVSWWATPSEPEPLQNNNGGDDDMAEFVLGFKDIADRLGKDVIGEPEVDERTLKNPDGSNVLTVQKTTKGLMVYMDGGQPIFLPGKA